MIAQLILFAIFSCKNHWLKYVQSGKEADNAEYLWRGVQIFVFIGIIKLFSFGLLRHVLHRCVRAFHYIFTTYIKIHWNFMVHDISKSTNLQSAWVDFCHTPKVETQGEKNWKKKKEEKKKNVNYSTKLLLSNSFREYWHILVFVSFLHAAIKNWCFCFNSPS